LRLPSQPVTMHVKDRADYEDLLSQWADLEAGLGIVLGNPASVQEFVTRIHQYDRWMQDLLARDTDIGLYLLFQLATQSTAGYSASHALICSVLCHLLAHRLDLSPGERDSLASRTDHEHCHDRPAGRTGRAEHAAEPGAKNSR